MKLLRRAILLLLEVLAVGALVLAAVVWPPLHEPGHADAVVVLSGDGNRLPVALRLMDRKVAPTLVFVGTPDTIEMANLCKEPHPFEAICLHPEPDSTRAEARATGRLARERGWESIVVVTTTYHASRAGLLFRRCFDGQVDLVAEYPRHGKDFARRAIVHEWLGILYATVSRGC